MLKRGRGRVPIDWFRANSVGVTLGKPGQQLASEIDGVH
jgi:hypothetical protein